MRDITKQLFRYIKYTKFFIKTLIVFVLITIAALVSGVAQMNQYTIEEFLGSVDTCTMFSTIIIISFISITLGNGFKNKTSYYLVMDGHSRFQIFFGKVIGLMPYTVILSLIQSGIMYSVLKFMTNEEFVNQYVHNIILNSFCFLTIYTSYALLSISFSFMTKSTIGGISGSLLIVVASNILYFLLSLTDLKLFSHEVSKLSGMFTFRFLLENYRGVDFQLSIIVIYTLLSIGYLFIGYNSFKKADLT